jgi:hypothetical protein
VILGLRIDRKDLHEARYIGARANLPRDKDIYLRDKDVCRRGKDIYLGGKDSYLGGKGNRLGGKDIYLGGKDIYLGGKDISFIGTGTLCRARDDGSRRGQI